MPVAVGAHPRKKDTPMSVSVPNKAVRCAFTVAAMLIALLDAGCSEGLDPLGPPLLQPISSRDAPTFTFSTIDVANASSTTPQGLNANGDIVGFYVSNGATRGFMRKNGVDETIVVSGASATFARGISSTGEIVGNWRPPGAASVVSFGFRRSSTGDITPITVPGSTHMIATRILRDGTVVGCVHESDMAASMVGVLVHSNSVEKISAFASMHNGSTPDGRRVVGFYANTGADNRAEGYFIDNGKFQPLLIPGSTSSAAQDVNSRGDIVGSYQDATGLHGFILTAAGYTTINFPSATATRVTGINDRGDLVGTYVLGGATHGFLARRN